MAHSTLTRIIPLKLRYSLAVAFLAVASMAIAVAVTDGPTFLSAQTAEPSTAQETEATAAAEVEIQRQLNELRREALDDRSNTLQLWLTVIGILATLVVGVAGYRYREANRLRGIEAEARHSAERAREAAEQATRDAAKVEEKRRQFEEEYASSASRSTLFSRVADSGPIEEAGRDGETVQTNTLLDKVIADAYSLRREGRVVEAIEKLRAFAGVTEGIDNDVAASAWFYVAYLMQEEGHEE